MSFFFIHANAIQPQCSKAIVADVVACSGAAGSRSLEWEWIESRLRPSLRNSAAHKLICYCYQCSGSQTSLGLPRCDGYLCIGLDPSQLWHWKYFFGWIRIRIQVAKNDQQKKKKVELGRPSLRDKYNAICDFKKIFTVNFYNFLSSNPWILIRVRIETNADAQHWKDFLNLLFYRPLFFRGYLYCLPYLSIPQKLSYGFPR